MKKNPARQEGVATLEAVIDRRLRRITVSFAKDDETMRNALIDAFKHRRRVAATGELLREGRGLRLEKPRDLAVLTPGEDE